jgi:hypothetical protein
VDRGPWWTLQAPESPPLVCCTYFSMKFCTDFVVKVVHLLSGKFVREFLPFKGVAYPVLAVCQSVAVNLSNFNLRDKFARL